MAENPSPWAVVCAIDFGTTYSGYAYSMRTEYERDPLKIETNPPWVNDGIGTLKTPTCILFDRSGNFHSFGYEAETKYITLAENAQHNNDEDKDEDEDDDSDEDDDDSENIRKKIVKEDDDFSEWLYFRRFKMKLFQNTSWPHLTPCWVKGNLLICFVFQKERTPKLIKLKLEAENGIRLPALKIFSEAIKYLKRHFENLLEKTMLLEDGNNRSSSDGATVATQRVIESNTSSWSNDILWILTVPAIWSDQAKQFMREAAIPAGIKDEQLLLALEPECAALFCKHLALTKKADECNVRTFDPGSKFMVVDCGGGTVDVTAYIVNKNRSLRELHCATGGAVGGTNVDKLFLDLLNDIYGENVMKMFKTNSPSDWQELLRSFEAKKRGVGNPDDSKNDSITFSNLGELSREFSKANENKTVPKRLKELRLSKFVKESNKSKLRFEKLFLIEKVIEGPVNDIVSHLQDLFKEQNVSDIDNILLVGGFSECHLLQDAARKAFPGKNIINPRDGSVSVLMGAVLFGHSPESLTRKLIEQGHPIQELEVSSESFIRKSRAYYGVATDVPFIEGEHSLAHQVFKDGIMMCSDIFDCLVKKNQNLEIGKTVIEKTFRATFSGLANVEIYRSEEDVQYCHDDGCKRIGEISAFYSEDADSTDRRLFNIQLHFGFTENFVIAKDLSTNKIWRAKLNCLL